MKLYEIDEDYTNYLSQFDSTVMYKKSTRKYVGVVLKIGDYKYFAPLTSPKPKHKNYVNSLNMVLIYSGVQHIGSISLNNMIPVYDIRVTKVVNIGTLINSTDKDMSKYGMLLKRQIQEINKLNFKNELLRKAKVLYEKQINYLSEHTTNFKLLEEKAKKYRVNHKISSPPGTTFKL